MSSPDLPAPVPALDALPCGFLQLDAEDRVVQWNQRLERWTRIPRSFAVGRLLPKLFPASLDLARILADTRSQGRPRVLAQQFHRWLIPVPLPSGHISGLTDMQQECHLVPLAEPAGHLAITILDVTPLLVGQRRSQALVAELTDARDRAETSLRIQAESEAQLRDLFDNTSELIQSVADDGRFLFVNAAWHRTLGYSPAELPALLVFDVIAPACQAHCREALQRLLAGEELGTLEVVFRAKDGRLITVEGSLTLRRTAGQPFSTRGIFRDVTARRAAEAGARRLALVAEHTTNLVVITDAAGLIEWVNPAFVRASGYTLAEVLGRKPGALLQGPNKDPATVAFMRSRLRLGQGFRAQVLNYAKDGRPYWAEIDVQPVHNEAGVLIQYIAIQTDITARLQAQAELLSYKDRLELALDAANTCTWESDVAENVLRLDARWSLMRGGEPRPTTNHPLAAIKLVHPDDREATLRHYRECHAGPANNYRIEQRVQTLQGDWIWILSSGRVVSRDATGRATRLIGTNTDITAQKRVEAQLAALNLQLQRMVAERTLQLSESEHRYRRLVGLLPVGVYTCDAAGLITYYNDEACRIWGHRPTLGDSTYRYCGAHRLWRPDGTPLPSEATPVAEAIRTGRSYRDVAVVIEHPDGRRVQALASIDPLHDETGAIVGAINALSDVTARRQAEAAQRESEQRFRSVFDHSPVIIALLSFPEGRVIELNPAAATAFGITRDEVLGRTSLELAVWADPADRTRYLQQLATTGSVRGFETRMRRRDGTLIHVLYSGSIVTIGAQQFSLNLLLDVSARIASEQARERSLSLLRATLESTADGILVVDDAGHIENFNRHFAELWRLPSVTPGPADEETVLSTMVAQLEAPEKFLESIRQVYLHSREEIFDVLHTKDGRIFERYSRPQLVNEVPAGRVWSFRDITARTRAEAERQRFEATLRQAQKLESLGTLAGGIAHDFNNILTGFFGFVELAQHTLPPGHSANEFLELAHGTADRARDLVRQILTFSRRSESERKPLQLSAVVSEALQLLRSTIPAMVNLHSDLTPGCPLVMADATQIHQIVMNLCTNAWHAVPESGGCIRVALAPALITPEQTVGRTHAVAGPAVRLTVADNGTGMDAPIVARIFEPFFTTKESGKGTGLGLAVVHGIVEAHRGLIEVHSERGRGTTFEIYLPSVVPSAQHSPAHPPPPSAVLGHGEHLLWVDDDQASGQVIGLILQLLNYRVTRCTDPLEALARFQAAPDTFAMVITDLAMPGISGATLAARLLEQRPALPVIVVSGYVDANQHDALRGIGVRAILHKPPTRIELATAIARNLPAATP